MALIEAVTRCVEFNNLGARAWPERVQNALELSMAAHARLAERELFTALVNGSVAVSAGQVLGTARDVLAHLSRAAVGYRQRHRTGLEFPLRAIFPRMVA